MVWYAWAAVAALATEVLNTIACADTAWKRVGGSLELSAYIAVIVALATR